MYTYINYFSVGTVTPRPEHEGIVEIKSKREWACGSCVERCRDCISPL